MDEHDFVGEAVGDYVERHSFDTPGDADPDDGYDGPVVRVTTSADSNGSAAQERHRKERTSLGSLPKPTGSPAQERHRRQERLLDGDPMTHSDDNFDSEPPAHTGAAATVAVILALGACYAVYWAVMVHTGAVIDLMSILAAVVATFAWCHYLGVAIQNWFGGEH